MMGDVLLIIDGQVNDSAHFKSDEEKQRIVNQFANIRLMLETEHPYSKVQIEIQEAINEER